MLSNIKSGIVYIDFTATLAWEMNFDYAIPYLFSLSLCLFPLCLFFSSLYCREANTQQVVPF